MITAAIYQDPGMQRSVIVARAMGQGIMRCGDRITHLRGWDGECRGDVAVAYGWKNRAIFREYRKRGKPFVYVDLGYWERKPKHDRAGGYHKVVVNERDANDYFRRRHPADRFNKFGLTIRPWRTEGEHILLAGMSEKSANHWGLRAEEWERDAIKRIRRHTDRKILYRPKPSWKGAQSLAGAKLADTEAPIEAILEKAWAVVTHHSNVGVDAMVAGVPIYTQEGIAHCMSMDDLAQIDDPPLLEGRAQFLADVAYVQWNVKEMASGACWSHLKAEGLLSC